MLRYSDVTVIKMAAVRIFYFYKFEFLTADTVKRVNMHHSAKFRADWCYGGQDMAVFRFFKIAAIRHLGFLKVCNLNDFFPDISLTFG